MAVIRVRTTKHTSFVNITNQVKEIVKNSGVKSGICIVYVPHTTACVFINEGADPDVIRDIAYSIEKLIPWRDNYAHSEGNSAAHIRSAIIGNSRVIPIEDGDLVLGTWEAIFLAEFDGPRERKVIVKVIED
ncbi:secondary thiamine-phosphate synthase enzyme YjbQ [Hydrogenobacter sp. T-2]|uniref:secondary thiamine-phosphate synthase enzyme YjbQ n=1 Tax=Pampinifervens diazotrophicum TaxID=1632018 RepID=UPI002B261DC7|nr:secondary thiamine-phosphate synthase enzyme YjbQ [Hydrogenobacter sp. T-2]WPM32434.1 secondary thiamine-phosphate synthase enzyme YjbQ [Hydrogenobacter sp. T-2]